MSIKKSKEILQIVTDELEDVYELLPYSEILHYNENLIVWEKGQTLERGDITFAYVDNELLFISTGKWMRVFLIE